MSFGHPPNRLMVSVGKAVQLIFFVSDLLLYLLHAIHRPPEPCNLRTERLVTYLLEGFIDLVTKSVVTAEAEQLLVVVVRHRAVVTIGSCVDVTLVYDSPFVHATPRHRVHSHTDLDPLSWGDTSSISGEIPEGEVIRSLVVYETVGSGG
jgi:hypothetical protein